MISFLKNKSNYLKSVKWGGFSIVLVFLKQILLVPVFLTTLGKENYAFWLIISSIALMIRALSLGQLNYFSNSINLSYHIDTNDTDSIITRAQGANVIFFGIQMLIGFIISFPVILSSVFDLDVAILQEKNASLCLLFLLFGRLMFQHCSLFVLRLFEPISMIEKTIKWRVLGELLDFSVTIIVITLTKSLLFTCIGIAISNFLYTTFIYNFLKNKIPFNYSLFKKYNFVESLVDLKKSFSLTVSFIIEKVYEVGLNLVVVQVYTNGLLPLFSTTRVLSNSSLSVSNILAIPLMPNIQKQFALKNESAITQQMVIFWRISTSMIIFVITAGLPFFPYLFNTWTAGKIDLNITLMCFLFMAIVFQNYAIMFTEFFKKTNLSKEILTYNILKVSLTIIGLAFFGFNNIIEGMGIAIFIGELCGLTYFFIIIRRTFSSKDSYRKFFMAFLPVILFSITLIYYAYTEKYLILVLGNIFILTLSLVPNILNRKK